MTFIPVAVYTLDGTYLGLTIKDSSVTKLQTINLYAEGEEQELQETLDRLNETSGLQQFWPHPQDPEVLALLADPKFHPIEYEDQQVVDDERSHLVYDDENFTVNREASNIVYKTARLPKRPIEVKVRLRQACETVATRRANAA